MDAGVDFEEKQIWVVELYCMAAKGSGIRLQNRMKGGGGAYSRELIWMRA